MKRIISLLIFIATFNCYAQNVDSTFTVTFVESARANMPTALNPNAQSTGTPVDSLKSRQGKFIALIYDDYYLTEGIIRCVYEAMCLWEEYISITNPIVFDLLFDDDMDDQDEMETVVLYNQDRINRTCIPHSLMSQIPLAGNLFAGTITVNANIDWDSSWGYDSPYGFDKFTTAMLRHIAHLLGFGSSLGYRGNNLTFTGRFPSSFDMMIVDEDENALALNTNLGNFLSNDIYLKVGSHKYPLFSSQQGYVTYRTANYFSSGEETIMEYPYINVGNLLNIDSKVIEVLGAIGWTIIDDRTRIVHGANLDTDGYGSYYPNHTFGILPEGATVNSWVLQLYNNSTHQYQDVEAGYGQTFSPVNYSASSSYVDEFNCVQARIRCTLTDNEGTSTHSLPLFLDLAPWLNSYEISNVTYNSTNNTYEMDFIISQYGSTLIRLYVSNDFMMSQSYLMPVSTPSYIHVTGIPLVGDTYLDLTMENSYGTAFRYIPIDLQGSTIQQGLPTTVESEGRATIRHGSSRCNGYPIIKKGKDNNRYHEKIILRDFH